MNELIKITKQELNGEVVETSDARELHKKLGSKRSFSNWVINKINKGIFEEGKDYWVNKIVEPMPKGKGGFRYRTDYSLSVNTSEHIALMEGTETGKRVRQFYIDHRRESEKVINRLLIELQWKNKFLAEDVTKEKSLRSRAVRQADHNLRRLRQVLIDTRIKESELKIDTPNKDGNLINRIIPTYSKHDPRLGGKIKKLDDNQPYLPSLAFKPKAQGE